MKLSESRLAELTAMCKQDPSLNPALATSTHRVIAIEVEELAELIGGYRFLNTLAELIRGLVSL